MVLQATHKVRIDSEHERANIIPSFTRDTSDRLYLLVRPPSYLRSFRGHNPSTFIADSKKLRHSWATGPLNRGNEVFEAARTRRLLFGIITVRGGDWPLGC
ncbi:unnamed protein product, partial [Mesorhabditis spiculigera]